MSKIKGVTGPGQAGFGNVESSETQVSTVRSGETSLADVAKRLNLDLKASIQANPHIRDPYGLKAGQEIRLPKAPSDSLPGRPEQPQEAGPPLPPSDDSIGKAFAQLRLNQGTVAAFQQQSTIPRTVQPQAPAASAAVQADIDALGQAAATGDLQKNQRSSKIWG